MSVDIGPAALALAAILRPTKANTQALVDALVAADDDTFGVTWTALEATYPDMDKIAPLVTELRRRRSRS